MKATDEQRWQAAWATLTSHGFTAHRAKNSEGKVIYAISRWARTRTFESLDQVAVFIRIALAAESDPP